MAVQSNSSDTKVVNERKLYTGIATVNVVAINPNQEELKKMGINAQQEPKYTTDVPASEGNPEFKKTRIDIYVASMSPSDLKTKISFWIEDRKRFNKDGDKVEWINKLGQASWSTPDAPPSYEWYKKEGARIAKPGEVDLHNFIIAWANVANGGNCQLETIDAIAKGDVKELKEMATALKANNVKVLLGVTSGDSGERYQGVYTKHFARSYQSATGFVKSLESKYGEFKNADYQNSLELKSYVPTLTAPDQAAATAASPAAASGGGINF